jgi:hypothetical protein
VLDNVERGRFLVDPAREHPPPLLVGTLDVELQEGAGQLLGLPRRRRLAGAQADDRVLGTHRLAGLHPEVMDDPVALVEEADDRHALVHRSDPRAGLGGRPVRGRRPALLLRLLFLPASGEREDQRDRPGDKAHVYSGIQGW